MSAAPRSPRGALSALARWVGPRRWRLVGASGVLLAYALLWVLEANAANPALHTQLFGLAVTIPALLVLIAGGSMLSDWVGVRHRPPQFSDPRGSAPRPGSPGEEVVGTGSAPEVAPGDDDVAS